MTNIELPKLKIDRIFQTSVPGRLSLINRFPGPDAIDVFRTTSINLDIVDMGTSGIDRESTRVWLGDILTFANVFQAGFGGDVFQTADSLRLSIFPQTIFPSQSVVIVRVTSSTVDGADSINEVYSFTIEDRTQPKVVAAQAIGPRHVRIAFDEDLVIVDPHKMQFVALGSPAVPVSAISAIADGSVIEVVLNTDMTPDVAYAVTADGCTDSKGNPVDPLFATARFQGFRSPRPSNRRFDLWTMLPKYNRRMDATGDLRKFISCLQEVTDLLLADVDRFSEIFDIERAPESFLDLILQDLGNPFKFDLEEIEKRRLAATLLDMYFLKGTAPGIKNAVRFFLGLEIDIIPYSDESLVLGESELGEDWVLAPSASFARYAFDVMVDQKLSDIQRKQIRMLIEEIRPAHAHFISLKEPAEPEVSLFWVLGVGELGAATMLG